VLGPPPLLVALDLLGIFVFALSGGLVAVRKELDISMAFCGRTRIQDVDRSILLPDSR